MSSAQAGWLAGKCRALSVCECLLLLLQYTGQDTDLVHCAFKWMEIDRCIVCNNGGDGK